MTEIIDYYKDGQNAARHYYKSRYPAGYIKNVKAEDAIKIFLPPVNEQLVQIAMPLPKPRQKWIAGFKKEQITILADMERLKDDGR